MNRWFKWEWDVFMKTMRRIRAQRAAEAAGVAFVDFDEVMEAIRLGGDRLATPEEIEEFWS